jgi:hypothetical protein
MCWDHDILYQDGAPPYFGDIMRLITQFLFASKWKSRRALIFRLPRSPDLIPVKLFSLSYVEDEVWGLPLNSDDAVIVKVEHIKHIYNLFLESLSRCVHNRLFQSLSDWTQHISHALCILSVTCFAT